MIIHARNFITPDRALGGIQIENSLRFEGDDTTYLSAAPTFNTKKYTFSFWMKPVKKGGGAVLSYNMVGNNRQSFSYSDYEGHFANQLRKGGSRKSQYATTAAHRDFSSWYHVVYVWDTDNGTQDDRFIVYVNGEREAMTQYTGTVSGETGYIGSGNTIYIGRSTDGYSPARFYLADYYLIDGQAYDPTYFGYTDAQTGQWRPKKYTGSYGSGGFHLEFKDSSNLGKDTSGNANNWTANNFSTSAGAGKDQVTDSPTNNFCVMNVIDRDSSVTVTDGGLKVSNNNQVWAGVKGTFAVNSGKWYYEMKTENANIFCGWASDDLDTFLASPQDNNSVMSDGVLIFCDNGKYQLDTGGSGTRIDYSSALSANDVLGCAIDLDNNTAQFYKNGTALGSIDISSSKLATKHVHPYFISYYTSSTYTFDFGQQGFVHTPPAGYRALNSKNIATPVPAGVVRPQRFFDTILYTGDGASVREVTGLEFQPDMVWVKSRSQSSSNHGLTDSVKTDPSYPSNHTMLYPNLTNTETGGGNYFTLTTSSGRDPFLKDGFVLNNNTSGNNNGSTYVAWCWKAGGAAVSNTDGTITSQVSANTEAGFSIVTYTGNHTSGATVGHGLGKTPKWIIVKARGTINSQNRGWNIYHASLGNTKYIQLQSSNASVTNSDWWNNTSPNSTTFTLGNDYDVNANVSGGNYVAYCWAEIPGYSKFGNYKGNGSDEGTYIDCGFKPAWVLIKNTSSSSTDWIIKTAKISTSNQMDEGIKANSSDSEYSSLSSVDFLANGFKIRNTGSFTNSSNETYIFMAFAERPSGTMFGLDANAR